jgi:plastocyanin
MMKTTIGLSFCALWLVSSNLLAQDTATLRMKIVVDGAVADRSEVKPVADPICAENKILSDKILVGPKGELSNLAIIFDEEKSKLKVPEGLQKAAATGKLQLDNNKCMFAPKVVIARPGQTIDVKNSDQTGHNANFQFLKNKAQNFLIPAGQTREYVLAPDLVEPTAMPVNCDVHPWMKAFVIVKNHPYVGVTNAEGVLEIKDLPVGKDAIFRVWHEAAGPIDQLTVGGKAQKLSRGNRWEMELKPGINDLGEVKIDAKLLKP